MVGLMLIIAAALFGVSSFKEQEHALLSGIDAKLLTTARLAREILPANYHDKISGADSVSETEYLRIVDRWNLLCKQLGLEYIWSLMLIDGKIVFTSGSSTSKDVNQGDHALFFETHSNPELYETTFATMKPQYQINDDKWGRIKVALLPFKDAQGRAYLFGASMKMTEVDSLLRKTIRQSLQITAGILIFGFFLSVLLASSLARPLEKLTNLARSITNGNWGQVVETSGAIEIRSLAHSINEMSQSIQDKITERKIAQEALHDALWRLSSIIEGTHVGTWEWNVQTGETVFNETWAEIVGYTLDELSPISIKTWEELVHPDDRKYSGELLDRHFAGELPNYNCECRMKHKDGHWVWVLDCGRVITHTGDGKPLMMFGTHTDITDRKQAEEACKDSEFKYRSLIEHSSDVVFCVDRNGEYKFVNQVFASTFGKTPDYFLGKTFWDIYPKEHADYRQAASSRVFETGESQSLEVVVPLPDRTLYFLAKTNPVRDETGNVVLNLTHATDITALKRIEAEKVELEVQTRQLQKSESLGRMAGAIAHHFNNQLYAVMGNLEMAIDGQTLGVNSNENLVSAMQAARKAADVSRLMLTYLGQTPGKQEPIDLSEAYSQSQTLLQAAAPRGIIINAEFPPSGPVIRADTNQMHQILTNLVTNAWESISDNRGTIGLSVKTISHEDIPISNRFPLDWQTQSIPYACLEVSDTGHGIPDRDIEKLFDPFFTTKFTGRGLGLSVVMGIVKAHGGGVTVESEPGRGSTFRIFLPVSTEELPIQHDLPAISEALQTGKAEKISKNESGGTVLLIEDEEQVRKMAGIMLTRLGYTVLEAKDGVEAQEVFKQHQDEILFVLSDLTMPRLNGWETLTALRKFSPEIPVILSSGYDEAQVLAGEHSEHPNAFLGKPYDIKRLSDMIRRVLANEV
jgi:PAS domain S-box-containing protein